jgi:hypothetical protein
MSISTLALSSVRKMAPLKQAPRAPKVAKNTQITRAVFFIKFFSQFGPSRIKKIRSKVLVLRLDDHI